MIKKNIIFRKYNNYGYITDNSHFGYRALSDKTPCIGEKYISESGAIMLSVLTKIPQPIDYLINKMLSIFSITDMEDFRTDVINFYSTLIDLGFLCCGESYEKCIMNDQIKTQLRETTTTTGGYENTRSNKFELRSLHIEITSMCNERCIHCYIPHSDKCLRMNPDLFYKIVGEGRAMNIVNVTLSGGEPLLHECFLDFLRKCRELDLSVNILSNLTLLTEDIILEMKKNPLLSVQTSIYSMDSDIHDLITKNTGSHEKTINSILKLHSNGIPIQISCPLMKQNMDSFEEVICFGKRIDAFVNLGYVLFAEYNHSNHNLKNRLSVEEIERIIDKQLSRDYAEEMLKSATEKEAMTVDNSICDVCHDHFCISADGIAFPCAGWRNNEIANLNTHTVKDIWESSTVIRCLRQITYKHFPKCFKCKDKGYCKICMMNNSNESILGNAFEISEFHCQVASLLHNKVKNFFDNLP